MNVASQVLRLRGEDARRAAELIAEQSLPSARGCLDWIGPVAGTGSLQYGKLYTRVDGEWRVLTAHRAAYMVERELAERVTVDHLCYNTFCVNTAHLEAVTLQENIARRRRAGRPPLRGADGLCVRCGAEYISYEHASGKMYSRCPNGTRRWHAELGKTA